MRKLALLAATAFAALSTPALAVPDVNPPTLHGFCSVANPCPDLGSNSPTGVNPPVFGFATSGASDSGTLYIVILTPDNLGIPGPFTFTGYLTGTASHYSSTPWTSDQLDAFIGIPQETPPEVNPANPIGAFLHATQGCGVNQGCDPGATGFYVFEAAIAGTTTLPGNSGTSDSEPTRNTAAPSVVSQRWRRHHAAQRM